jgi:hypothetical protein
VFGFVKGEYTKILEFYFKAKVILATMEEEFT